MTYEELRPQMQTGDKILWQGDKPLQKAIMWFTPYSHASTIVRYKRYPELAEHVFLIEALRTGLEPRYLSDRIKNEGGRVFFYKVTENINRDKIRAFATIECSKKKKYDYGSFLRLMFGSVSMDARRYLCSEFCFYAIMAGADKKLLATLKERSKGKAPTPADIPKWVKGELIEITA